MPRLHDTLHLGKVYLHVVICKGLRVVPRVWEPAERGFHLVATSPDCQRWVRVQTARLVGDLCPHLPKQPRNLSRGIFHIAIHLISADPAIEMTAGYVLKAWLMSASQEHGSKAARGEAGPVGKQVHAVLPFFVSSSRLQGMPENQLHFHKGEDKEAHII